MMLDKTAFMSADCAAFVYSCSVRDFRAQSACVCMYIYCMRYQKGQICLLKHVKIYLDKVIFCQYMFLYLFAIVFK